MGVGLSEYRVAIGRFAAIAVNASCRGKRKWKMPKVAKMRKGKSEELRLERQEPINIKRSQSLRSEKGNGTRGDLGQRSRSLNNRPKVSGKVSSRMGSQNSKKRRQEEAKRINNDIFRNACIACKTDLFDQMRKRGRAAKTLKNNICPHIEQKPTTTECFVEEKKAKLFACFAISVWFTLERAVTAVVQILLLRSGIERNPGPTNENNYETNPIPKNENKPFCCNASQHFNRVKNTIAKTQKKFQSKVLADSLSKRVIEVEETGGQKSHKSIEDLKAEFKKEYKADQLISIPVVKLQRYESVPVCLTEDDVRANIEMEEEEILEEKIPKVRSKKSDILSILSKLKFNPMSYSNITEVSGELNDLLFDDVFSGNSDGTNSGVKTSQEKAKRDLRVKWEGVLQELEENEPEKNFGLVEDFMMEELKKGIHTPMQKEIQGILANMVGRNTENNLTGILESLFAKRPGLLLNGFNVREGLALFFDAFNITLKEYGNNDGAKGKKGKGRKEIEHDILYIAPHKDKVNVSFVQAKSQLNVPWTQAKKIVNTRRVIEKACSQGVADVDTFSELASHFLTDDQFKMIIMKFSITMSDLSNIPETEICEICRKSFIFEEEKAKGCGNKYSAEELQNLFGQPEQTEPLTSGAKDIFLLLSSIYAGGGSLVKLKSSKEKYERENTYLQEADQMMQKMMQADTTTQPSRNAKTALNPKWVSRNVNIKLSPAQNNLYNSGIGLRTGYCMIGGHGTGKSMMIQLEVTRAARLHTEEGTKAAIYVVVWEMKAKELLESYKRFAETITHSTEIELRFLNKEALCNETQVEFEGLDTTSIINNIVRNLSGNKAVYLFIDEVEVENPGVTDMIDLIGKTPFCFEGDIFPWSNLDPRHVRLVVAVASDSQDLAPFVDVEEADKQRLRSALEVAPKEKIPTVVLWRVFRCSNAIQNTVEHLQVACSKKDKEFGFAVDPKVQIRGHDVQGDLVEWIPCNETEHMICNQECRECFLLMINEALAEKIKILNSQDGVPLHEVTVIVSSFSRKRTPEDNRIKAFLAKSHPGVNIKLNFEMEGLEAPTVILIRNGGLLGHAISLGVSRATTKLVVISTDDNGILENAVKGKKVKKMELVLDERRAYDHVKITEDSDKARWSCIGSTLNSLHKSIPIYVQILLKRLFEEQQRIFMVQDSERGPSNSLQEVTECLCDDRMMPLHQNLCFRAIPHYEVFVGKREPKVKRRLVERDAAEKAEKKAEKEEQEAGKRAAAAEQQAKQEKDPVKKDKFKQNKAREEVRKNNQGWERKKQKDKKEQIDSEIPEQYRKFLTGDNQPIPIKNEHEFAFLYLDEAYRHFPMCDIHELNLDALLTILSKESSVPEKVREQAKAVRELRNKWLCSEIDFWTADNTAEAISCITHFAQLISGGVQSIKLKTPELKFPGITFLVNLHRYRFCIRDGHHEKVEFKIERLQSKCGHEIYVERCYSDSNTGERTSSIKDLLLPNKVVLLKGGAGAGKSSVVTKLIKRWADGEIVDSVSIVLFLTAGSDREVALQRIIWDGNNDICDWKEEDFLEAYRFIKNLAIEGKVLVLIDGLDEMGTFSKKDVLNANQIAQNPHLDVDMRTTCAGILAQKIFPGARVLATGRTTNLINEQILEGKASLFDLEPLTVADRDTMVEKLEGNTGERERIQQELNRISTKSSEVFFKTPLSIKNVIELIQERKVDVTNLKNSAEIYLMFSMKNLDFHTDQNTCFTELDPPEHQDYLKWCMMICQEQIQSSDDSESINTVVGHLRNVKAKELCFEKKVLNEHFQIPLDFIKKLGFFDIRKEENRMFLDIVHLSYMEFSCAGSLCREEVDIELELCKIKDTDRFEAVTTYMAGLFSQNPSIQFLTTVKHIARNFLLLLGNDRRESCIQTVFRTILKRSDLKESGNATIQLAIPGGDEFTLQGARHIQLLIEALRASSDSISPEPTFNRIHIPLGEDNVPVERLTQLVQLQHNQTELTTIERLTCKTESDLLPICSLLSVSSWRTCTIAQFAMNSWEIRNMKIEKGKKIQLTIGHWKTNDNDITSINPLLDCMSNNRIDEVIIEQVDCIGIESSLENLISLLRMPQLKSWTIKRFDLGFSQNIRQMKLERGEVSLLTIGCWTGQGDPSTGFLSFLDFLSLLGIEEVKIKKVESSRNGVSLVSLISLLSTPSLQSWMISELEIDSVIKNPWKHLTQFPTQGRIKSIIFGGSKNYQYVERWAIGDLESLKISMDFIQFDCCVSCKTDDAVRTLVAVLALPKQYVISKLLMPNNISAMDVVKVEDFLMLSSKASERKTETKCCQIL